MPKEFILTDWKHWTGWIITTALILTVFYFLMEYSVTPVWHWWYAGVLLLIIAITDTIKHYIHLQ